MSLPDWFDPVGAALGAAQQAGGVGTQAGYNRAVDIYSSTVAMLEQYENQRRLDEQINAAMGYLGTFGGGSFGGGGGGGGGGYGGVGGGGGGGVNDEQRKANYEAEIRNTAHALGLSGDWWGLAGEAVANNWTMDVIKDRLIDRVTGETFNAVGQMKTLVDKTRAAASDYFIDVPMEDIQGWAKRIASDELSEEAVVTEIRDRAKAKWTWLSDAIDRGVTMKQYFQPHQQEIARMLEVAPEYVDFQHDMRWWPVMRVNQMDGTTRSMDLQETQRWVRGLDEWKGTQNAKSDAATSVSMIGRVLGKVA